MGNVLPFLKPDELPEPPAHLSDESKERWEEICRRWILDVDGLMLLQAALEQWDGYRKAQGTLAEEGPTVVNPDSGMVRQHPASLVARDSLRSFRLLMKDLGLDPAGAS